VSIVKNLILMSALILPLATSTGTAQAGKLDRVEITTERQWQASKCHKPVPPSTKVYDVVTYNVAVSLFNTYRNEVDAYFACASREAEGDFTTFRAVLTSSLESLQSNVLSQFEGLKQDLELSRKAFE